MKNRTYSIRRVSVGIASIIIGLSVWGIDTVNAAKNSNISTSSKVIIDEDGVRPIAELNPSENVKEELKRKPPIKSEEKPALKPIEKPSEKSTEKPIEQLPVKSLEKETEKPTTNFLETKSKVEIKNDVLVGNLSGREIKVSFKKGSISAEKLYVEPLNDNDLNQTIKNKLGSRDF